MRRLVVLLAVAVLCATSVNAFAYDGEGWQGRGHKRPGKEEMEKRHQQMVEDLGLTQQQQEEFEALRVNHRDGDHRKNMKDKREQLRELLDAEEFDETKIQALVAELKDAQAQMLDQRIAHIKKVRSILTPEQYKKFRDKIHSRRPGKGGPRDGGCPPEEDGPEE